MRKLSFIAFSLLLVAVYPGCQQNNPSGPQPTPTFSSTPLQSHTPTITQTASFSSTPTLTHTEVITATSTPTATFTEVILSIQAHLFRNTIDPSSGDGYIVGVVVDETPVAIATVLVENTDTTDSWYLPYTGGGVYALSSGYQYNPGDTYRVSVDYDGDTFSHEMDAPGDMSIAPDGSSVSWTYEGNADIVAVVGPSSALGWVYTGMPDLTSPHNIPASTYSNGDGAYYIVAAAQEMESGASVFNTGSGSNMMAIADSVGLTITVTSTFTSTPLETETFTSTSTITETATPTSTATPTNTPVISVKGWVWGLTDYFVEMFDPVYRAQINCDGPVANATVTVYEHSSGITYYLPFSSMDFYELTSGTSYIPNTQYTFSAEFNGYTYSRTETAPGSVSFTAAGEVYTFTWQYEGASDYFIVFEEDIFGDYFTDGPDITSPYVFDSSTLPLGYIYEIAMYCRNLYDTGEFTFSVGDLIGFYLDKEKTPTPTATPTFTPTFTFTDTLTSTSTPTFTVTVTNTPLTMEFANGSAPDAGYAGNSTTVISSHFPDYNYGSCTVTLVGWEISQSNAMRALFFFNISEIPVSAIVIKAYFTFYASAISGSPSVQLYPLNVEWSEGSSCQVAGPGASWLTSGLSGWTGGDYSATALLASPRTVTNVNNTVEITQLSYIQDWVSNPSQNYGMLMKVLTESGATADFGLDLDELAAPSNRPRLTIHYYLP